MNRLKYIIHCLLLSAGLLSGLVPVSCGSGTPAGLPTSGGGEDTAGLLTVVLPLPGDEQRSYDTLSMGRMAEGEVIEGRFRVANRSDRPLVIVQVITGCGCTTADYDPAPIASGDTILMTWRFDSRGRFGQQFKSIEIITAERQCATVYLAGEVTPNGKN